jgi:hypothetical protein
MVVHLGCWDVDDVQLQVWLAIVCPTVGPSMLDQELSHYMVFAQQCPSNVQGLLLIVRFSSDILRTIFQ